MAHASRAVSMCFPFFLLTVAERFKRWAIVIKSTTQPVTLNRSVAIPNSAGCVREIPEPTHEARVLLGCTNMRPDLRVKIPTDARG